MPPVQKTFDLIPNALGSGLGRPGLGHNVSAVGPAAKPPMTSKQAKKLYKQANKAPKLSKAEQRRIELMEQDRIRKELEKEKAQARARVARDRKKAKEEAQREAKKKKGLPLVAVRPSQDTIARFVRGNGTGKKRDSNGAELYLPSCLQPVGEEASDRSDKENEDPRQLPEARASCSLQNAKIISPTSSTRLDLKDLYNECMPPAEADFPGQSENVRLTELVTPHSEAIPEENPPRSCSLDTEKARTDHAKDNQSIAANPTPAQPTPAQLSVVKSGTDVIRNISQAQAEQAGDSNLPNQSPGPPTPHSTLIGHVRSTLHKQLITELKTAQQPAGSLSARTPVISRVLDSGAGSGPVVRPEDLGMRPPPLPPRFRPSQPGLATATPNPKFLPKQLHTPHAIRPVYETDDRTGVVPETLPPTSTQFMLNHIDDLFPSPSQEARELLEETHPSLQKAQTFASPAFVQVNAHHVSSPNKICGGANLPQDTSKTTDIPEVPFFSSQDFFLSSQDVRELENRAASSGKSQQDNKRMVSAYLPECANQTPRGNNVRFQSRESQLPKPAIPNDTIASKPLFLPRTHPGHVGAGSQGIYATTRSGHSTASRTQQQRSDRLLATTIRDRSSSHQLGHCGNQVLGQSLKDSNTAVNQSWKGNLRASRVGGNLSGSVPPAILPACSTEIKGVSVAIRTGFLSSCALRSSPKKRVFSSSGIGADSLCAMERSHRLFHEEQQQASSGTQAVAGVFECKGSLTMTHAQIAKRTSESTEEDFLGDELEHLPTQVLRIVEDASSLLPSNLVNRSGPDCPSSFPGASLQDCRASQPLLRGMFGGSSQETDYGDFEIGSDELELLGVSGLKN